MEEAVKQIEAMGKDPDMLSMLRTGIEMGRAQAKTQHEANVQRWEQQFPGDPKMLLARRLREFLDVTADVDFDAALVDRGGKKVFAEPRYESKSADWKVCFRAGQAAMTAARAAAAAWLKELQ
jgi:hypothetical protein